MGPLRLALDVTQASFAVRLANRSPARANVQFGVSADVRFGPGRAEWQCLYEALTVCTA